MIHVKTFGFYSAGGRMPLVDFYFFNFKNVIFLKNFVIVPSLQKYYKNYAENLSTYFRFTDYQFAHLLQIIFLLNHFRVSCRHRHVLSLLNNSVCFLKQSTFPYIYNVQIKNLTLIEYYYPNLGLTQTLQLPQKCPLCKFCFLSVSGSNQGSCTAFSFDVSYIRLIYNSYSVFVFFDIVTFEKYRPLILQNIPQFVC